MAGHDDGDDFFSDDDLDALPHDALAELENNAIQFTQAQQPNRMKALPSSDYGDDFEDEDLDDAVVIDESKSTPAIIPALRRKSQGQAAQQEQFRQHERRTISSPSLANRQRLPDFVPPRFSQPSQVPPRVPIAQNESMVVQQGSQPDSGTEDKVDNLQRQIEEVITVPAVPLPC